MNQKDYSPLIARLNKHNISAPLVREFLSKGLTNASVDAIKSELVKLETQSTVLMSMALELTTEYES